MFRTSVIIIGGGQAGLAMSHCLTRKGVDHVVLERGRVGERWRSERWDSLRLLTPNWMTRLPGRAYDGPDPDGFMSMPELVRFLEDYAADSAAPVETGVFVRAVTRRHYGRYRVETSHGAWEAPAVVIATGQCGVPLIPPQSAALPDEIDQLTPTAYRNPSMVRDGGVLVVGASASGLQLAEELARAGRDVTLSVGRHIRLPRRYLGRDILWWFDRMGILDEPAHAVSDLNRARRQPSMQLVGRPDHASLDLGALQALGVRLAGRAGEASGSDMRFADDLSETMAQADARMARLLGRVDTFAGTTGARPLPLSAPRAPARLDLRAEGINTVIWATGFRRDYSWLHVPVLDAAGEIIHDGGVTSAPGLVVLGLRFLRHRSSNFIGGVGKDAEALSNHLVRHLATVRRVVAA